jgi:hypothetical protein
MEKKQTSRGFNYYEFEDRYGEKCVLQESSLLSENCVWLGISDPRPIVMASQAKQVGVKTSETVGWVPYPIPDEVMVHTLMHLNKEQAGQLVELLNRFIDSGEL